jgi:hypothetical protein
MDALNQRHVQIQCVITGPASIPMDAMNPCDGLQAEQRYFISVQTIHSYTDVLLICK